MGDQEGRRGWASLPSLCSARADPLVTNTAFVLVKESHCPGFGGGGKGEGVETSHPMWSGAWPRKLLGGL